VVTRAYLSPFTVASRFVTNEGYAFEVALACEMRLITLRRPDRSWGREWRPTKKGLQFMEEADV